MKRIKDIRENYDLVTEKEQTDISKLTALVRAGLFDAKKIGIVKRALEKNPAEMTLAERKILIELLDSLMSEVLHSQQVYSKVKQNVMGSKEKMNEAAKDSYLTKFDPRMTKYPSESDIPAVLILKRKAIRIYPDNQKVALYYAQAIDKYVSIPYGNINTAINESKPPKERIQNVPINTIFGSPEKEKEASDYISRSSVPTATKVGYEIGLKARKKFGPAVKKAGDAIKKADDYVSDKLRPVIKKVSKTVTNPVSNAVKGFKQDRALGSEKSKNNPKDVKGSFISKWDSPMHRAGTKVSGFGTKTGLYETFAEKLEEKRTLKEYSKGELAWDAATAIPVVGNVLSAGEAAYKAAKGDYVGAGLAAASAVPGAGNAAKVAKIGYKGTSALVKGAAKKRAEKEIAKDVKKIKPKNEPEVPTTKPTEVKPKNEPEVPTTKPTEKPKGKPDKTPDTEPAEVPKPKTEPKPETEVKPKTETKPKPETEVKPKTETKPKPETEVKPSAKPSLAKRIGSGIAGAAGAVGAGLIGALAGASGSDQPKEKKFTEPKGQFKLGAKVSSAERFDTEVARNRKRESQYDKSLVSEDVITQLYTIKENYSEGYININNDNIVINKNVAEKVINVFESLNEKNQKKVDEMLNESIDSFKKIINFAVRQ